MAVDIGGGTTKIGRLFLSRNVQNCACYMLHCFYNVSEIMACCGIYEYLTNSW